LKLVFAFKMGWVDCFFLSEDKPAVLKENAWAVVIDFKNFFCLFNETLLESFFLVTLSDNVAPLATLDDSALLA
jgi:hypothetical protein